MKSRSPDSDIFWILLHYAHSFPALIILLEMGTGNKQRLLDMSQLSQLYSQDLCTALLSLHAFTRCYSTSVFKGLGKVKPLKTLPKYIPALSHLGNAWDISDDVLQQLEAFTCAIYGKAYSRSVDCVHYERINELVTKKNSPPKNFDMSSLPPCKRAFVLHAM